MSNLQVEANQSTNNIPITLTPKQQPTLLLTPDKVWGTKDYKDLENKPSLNGRELTKGMTLADFNLHPDKVEKNEEDIININEYLKKLTPKNTAEGESSLYIKDALELPIFEMSIDGNSYQQQTTGKQLYNYKDTTQVSDGITVDEEGWITATYDNTDGTATKFLNYWTNNLNLKADTDYLVVMEIKSVTGTGAIKPASTNFTNSVQNQGQFKEDNIYRHFSKSSNNTVDIIPRTTVSNPMDMTNGLRSYIYFVAGDSGSITFRLSVLEDTSITPETFVYEKYTGEIPSPNPDYPQEVEVIEEDFDIKSIGKNKLDLEPETFLGNLKGLTPSKNEDGSITITGTGTDTWSNIIKSKPIKLKVNEKNCFSIDKPVNYNVQLRFTHNDGSQSTIVIYKGNTSTSFVPTKETKSYYVYLYNAGGLGEINDTLKIQLEVGEVATEYEPYQEKITPIDLKGNFVGKLPNGVADNLLYKDRHIYLKKNVNKFILDNNVTNVAFTISQNLEEYDTSYISIYKDDILVNSRIISNYFAYKNLWNNDVEGCWVGNSLHIAIRILKEKVTTLEELKTWLSGKTVKFYYQLKEPQLIDLGEYDLSTLQGTNHISLLANIEPSEINITYALDLKKYYDNKIAELSNQLL